MRQSEDSISGELRAFVVVWELRGAQGAPAFGGARRVLAHSEADAEARARADIADELQQRPEAIEIVEVARM